MRALLPITLVALVGASSLSAQYAPGKQGSSNIKIVSHMRWVVPRHCYRDQQSESRRAAARRR